MYLALYTPALFGRLSLIGGLSTGLRRGFCCAVVVPRTERLPTMERRDFLALSAGPLVSPLASRVSRVLVTPPPPRRRHRGRRQAAILLLVAPPPNWQPRSWRDIPPVTPGAPVSIVGRYGAQAIGLCRSAAKRHNTAQTRTGISTWAVVACNDGRYHSMGTKGGAA